MQMAEKRECCSALKTTKRTVDTKKNLMKRLKTIEGQIRGVQNMIEEDKYCNDILIQLLAINKSIKSVSNEIFKSHLSTCVVREIKNDNDTIIDEVMDLVKKLN